MEILTVINLVTTVVAFGVGGLLAFRMLRQGSQTDDAKTIDLYERAKEARDVRISDLETELARTKDQVQLLTQQVGVLQGEKAALAQLVTGEKYLIELTKSVQQFQAFAERATAEHKEMLAGINDIKKHLTLTNRNGDLKP